MAPQLGTADGFPAGVPGYDSLELLGQGASGSVFKARQRSTGQLVAVKVPHATNPHDSAATRRLHQRLHHETRVCAVLHHPHIVRLLDKGLAAGGRPYAVFEFVPGETLADLLRRRGRLPLAEAVALMAQLLDALAWLHTCRIMHRDLKPQNIIVMSTGTGAHPKVLDFGIASRADAQGPHADGEGTPAYCAPEQLRGLAPSPQADLYAWGLLFVECLSGQPVLQGLSAAEARRWQLGPAPVPLPPGLRGHALEALLRKVLEKDGLRRAADAATVHRELTDIMHRLVAGPAAFNGPAPVHARAAAETEEGLRPEHRDGPGSLRLAVLCVGLRLDPIGDSAQGLDDLNALRREQIGWCTQVLRERGGVSAGVLGDRLLFHYPGAAQGGPDHLRQAVQAAHDLQSRARRRSRMLQLRQGVQLQLCTSVLATEPASGQSGTDLNRATHLALHLACRAPDGALLVGPEVEAGLHHVLRFEPWADAATPAFRAIPPHSDD